MLAIFDMDGTLADSSVVLANAINYVRSKYALKPLPKDEIIYQINNPECNYAEYFYNKKHISKQDEEWFQEYYSKYHNRDLVLFDGIKEMLARLKSKGIKLAVATNAYRVSTLEALQHLEIESFFDEIVSFDDIGEPKPSPAMLFWLLNRCKVSNKESIFVGDSQRDYLASKAANIEFVMVDFVNKKTNPMQVAKKIEEFFSIIQ
jgi:phosphoglycolate phosphatase